MSKINIDHFRLMLITQGSSPKEIEHEINAFLKGGGRWVQLRMKEQSHDVVQTMADRIAVICKSYGAIFVVNDYSHVAMSQYVNGVHLGKGDMSIQEARTLLGPDKIIGATANSLQDIQLHVAQGADYVGLGPFRFTTTKKNLSPTLGLSAYIDIIQKLKDLNMFIPVVAIGGITLQDVDDLLGAGVNGIAVSGSICQAPVIQLATKAMVNQLKYSLQDINS
jgi:thiamine-phosphate pyrophosphorylase